MADAAGLDDENGCAPRVVMVKTILGGGLASSRLGLSGPPSTDPPQGLTVWKPIVRGGAHVRETDHLDKKHQRKTSLDDLSGSGLDLAQSGSYDHRQSVAAGATIALPSIHGKTHPIPPTLDAGGGSHTAQRGFLRERHREELESKRLQEEAEEKIRKKGTSTYVPQLNLTSGSAYSMSHSESEDSDGMMGGAATHRQRRKKLRHKGHQRRAPHTARMNGILPYFPTSHAADVKLPPVAVTSRDALADFEKRNDLSDGDTPPQSPLASYENFNATSGGTGMKRYPSGKHISMRGTSRAVGLASGGFGGRHGRNGGAAQQEGKEKPAKKEAKRRRTRVVMGVETNPIFGMLCTVEIPAIAKAYEEVKREVRSVATAGLDPEAFCQLLKKLVPHVDLSEEYADKMFDQFETTVNNQTKRLQFPDFLRAYAQHAAPPETLRSIKFFFNIFEDPEAKGFMPIRCLDSAAVRRFTSDEVVGTASIKWQRLATVLNLERNIRRMVANAEDVIGTARQQRFGGGGQLEQLRKRSQLQEAQATHASRQALQQALASTMITHDDLKVLVFSSPRLFAAFNELAYPRVSLEQLVVGSNYGGSNSRHGTPEDRRRSSLESNRGGSRGRSGSMRTKKRRSSKASLVGGEFSFEF